MERIAARLSVRRLAWTSLIATTAVLAQSGHDDAGQYKRRPTSCEQDLRPNLWVDLQRRSPPREAALRPWLDSVFGDRAYGLVCDDKVCDLLVHDLGDCSWMLPLQTQADQFSISMPWLIIGCSGGHFNYETRAPLAH